MENAGIREGHTVLDVGAGDGLIGFGALDRVGDSGRVLLSDISHDLLAHSATLAKDLEHGNRSGFLGLSADRLPLADGTVDGITTRSVLIYLPAASKRTAIKEFHRVLRPGGRISLFEPINSLSFPEPDHLWHGFDVTPIQDLAAKVKGWGLEARLATHPLLDFDERDLVGWVEAAGFTRIRMQLEVDIGPDEPFADDWETFLKSSTNPLDPTIEESLGGAFTPDERTRFEAHVRPLFDRGGRIRHSAVAYLSAEK